ncbi:hypothetical protein J6590_015601 [Homalodisca vitripennis]|nr:hypothetical protein J6590_015601 [Homalodisca vitripennis]
MARQRWRLCATLSPSHKPVVPSTPETVPFVFYLFFAATIFSRTPSAPVARRNATTPSETGEDKRESEREEQRRVERGTDRGRVAAVAMATQ